MKRLIKGVVALVMLLSTLASFLPAQAAEGIQNVAVIALDPLTSNQNDKGHIDAIGIATIDNTNQTVKFAYIPETALVEVPGHGERPLSETYALGGAKLTLETLNNWLGVQIDDYLTVNLELVKTATDIVGGDITVTPSETLSTNGQKYIAGQTMVMGDEQVFQYIRKQPNDTDAAHRQRQIDIGYGFINSGYTFSWGDIPTLLTKVKKHVDSSYNWIQLGKLAKDLPSYHYDLNVFMLEGDMMGDHFVADSTSLALLKQHLMTP